jgi:transglutaminase-like putative cysteine protease
VLLNFAPEYAPQSEIQIPPGREGVIETLRIMRRLVREWKKHPAVRNRTLEVLNFAPSKEWLGEIERIFFFVRDHIRYTLDVNGIEVLQTPERTLLLGHGDCDDKAVLLASMLESVGHPTRFHAIGEQPGELTHVFVETRVGDDWFALDPTEAEADIGWSPVMVASVRDHAIVHN